MPEEAPKTPVVPQEPVYPDSETQVRAPVASAFVCSRCRKGRLDPTGLKMGEQMSCPECGVGTRVTLEHMMGEERASRRQKVKKTYAEMDEDEREEFLEGKPAWERIYIKVKHKVGPKGMIAIYLGLVLIIGGVGIATKLADGYTMQKVSIWVVLAWIGGGALLGLAGWFGHTTIMYHYHKKLAEKNQSSGRGSRRISRRKRSTRRKPSTKL